MPMSIGDGTQKQPNSADAAHPSEQKSKAAQIDLGELSREIGELMLLYCDAIGACTGIPRFSMLRLPMLFLRYLWWYLCLFAFFPVAAIDIVILAIRAIFGRPRVLVGRRLYARLKLPLLSAWSGQIPAILVFRWRYLARLLLFYRAQLTMNALHRAFNRRQLDLLFFSQEKEVADAEKFQKSFDLFQRITTDSYQIRALAIGGPLVALLAYAVQSAIQKAGPFVSSLWAAYVWPWWDKLGWPRPTMEHIGFYEGVGILAVLLTLWMLVSAWMEMHAILASFDLPRKERQAYLCARIKQGHQIPFDLILYISVTAAFSFWVYKSDHGDSASFWFYVVALLLGGVILGGGLLALGVIALARRLWLLRSTVAITPVNQPVATQANQLAPNITGSSSLASGLP